MAPDLLFSVCHWHQPDLYSTTLLCRVKSSCCCRHNLPHTWWLRVIQVCCAMVLKVRSPKTIHSALPGSPRWCLHMWRPPALTPWPVAPSCTLESSSLPSTLSCQVSSSDSDPPPSLFTGPSDNPEPPVHLKFLHFLPSAWSLLPWKAR